MGAVLAFPVDPGVLLPIARGAKARAAHWRAVEAIRARAEARWRVAVQARIQEDYRRVVAPVLASAVYPGELQSRIEDGLHRTEPAWLQLVIALYGDVTQLVAPRIRAGLKAQATTFLTKQDLRVMIAAALGADDAHEDRWTAVVERWLLANGAIRARNLSGQILAVVRREVARGVTEGLAIPTIAKNIAAHAKLAEGRAVVIARTEVIAASNLGARAGAIDTGLDLEHSWLATPGPRTRPAHAAANGQRHAMDTPFLVGGERLMFPGDASMGASAKNVIQCRCTVTFLPAAD